MRVVELRPLEQVQRTVLAGQEDAGGVFEFAAQGVVRRRPRRSKACGFAFDRPDLAALHPVGIAGVV